MDNENKESKFNLFKAAKSALGDAAEKVASKASEVSSAVADKAAEYAPIVTEKASEIGSAVADKASEIGSTVAEKAAEYVPIVTEKASEIGSAVADKAVEIGTTGAEFASAAAQNAAEAIDDAEQAHEEKVRQRTEVEIEEYAPLVSDAFAELEDTSAEPVLKSLGESPLPLTYAMAKQVKETFPVPREQTIVWADAEFDLRPSGIVATNKGVFIKSDAVAFSLDKKDDGDPTRSKLTYFPWEYFESSDFTGDDENNLALQVNPDCTVRFLAACRALANAEVAIQTADLETSLAELEEDETDIKAAIAAGAAVMSAEHAIFTEQKAFVNNPAGHGEMVEEAITKIDKLKGLDAKVVGRNNAKDGADRFVDGMFVQTKYYKSARGSLEACFDPQTHLYRYMDGSGKPMQLEVPKDQYKKVLEGFEWKIKEGKVPGVTDPEQAKDIVREGRLTYDQAVNLTKPGTVESLTYDAATGAVICSCAFGLSFLVSAFFAYRKTKDAKQAVQAGVSAGVHVFGISFIQHMAVSQLARTELAKTLIRPSTVVVQKLGSKASATIVNGLRSLAGKGAIHGAAATKSLAKIMRSNVLTSVATVAVFSVPETYKVVTKKASGAQYAKSMAGLVSSVVGGAGGTVAAGIAAAKVAGAIGTGITPGVGTAVGVAGGFIGGAAASAAANAVGDVLHEGDGATFQRLFDAILKSMVVEYLLDEGEIGSVVEAIDATKESERKKLLEDMFSSDEQEKVIRDYLTPIFDEVVSKREAFALPSDDVIAETLVDLEEEAEEETEAEQAVHHTPECILK